MTIKAASTRYFPIACAGTAAALFGLATPVSKLLLDDVNPFTLAGLLYLGAAIGLFPIILAKKELAFLVKLDSTNRKRLSGAVILGGMAGPILLLFGLRFASASSVSLLLNFELIATTVLGYLFFRDHLGERGWMGVAAALVSGILLTVHEGGPGILSAVLVCSACVCWGFDNHFTALIDGISATQSTFVKGAFAGTVNLVIGLLISGPPSSWAVLMYALALGSLSYGASIVLYIISAQKLGAIRSQIIFSGAPFFGVIFSMIVLGETISPLQMISFMLLIVSIGLIALERHEHRHVHREMEHSHLHRHDDDHHAHPHDIPAASHEHAHRHETGEHSHPHWPDIHHRHEHD